MRARDLIAGWRATVGDPHGIRWSDGELIEYLAEAQDEAALRRATIIDGSTPAACVAPFVIGQAMIDLHPKVLAVRSVRLAMSGHGVTLRSVEQMGYFGDHWQEMTGLVSHAVPDLTTGKLRLFRIPTEPDSLLMIVTRLPLGILEMDVELELRPSAQRRLRHWISYRAFMKPEVRDPPRAMEEFAEFEQVFGPRRVST